MLKGLLRSVKRPERLRAEAKEEARTTIVQGPTPADQADARVRDARDVKAMIDSPGWAIVQRKLIEKNTVLWKEFRDPQVIGDRLLTLRLRAVKYSGIEDILVELLQPLPRSEA